MKSLHFILTLILTLSFSAITWSQNDDLEQSVEDAQNALGELLGSFLQSQENVELPASYNFDQKILFETRGDKMKDAQDFEIAWSKSLDIVGIVNEENYMVMDNPRSLMVIYDLKDKTVTSLPNIMKSMSGLFSEQEDQENKIINVKKTGKRKTMLGMNCEEVLVETEEETSINWITYDLGVSLQELMQSSTDIKMESLIDEKYAKDFKGALPMYSEATNKKTGKKSYMEVKNIDKGFSIDNSQFKPASADE